MSLLYRLLPELDQLDPVTRKAAWQAGFGAVSARPIHLVAALPFILFMAFFITLGEFIVAGWVGRIIGGVLGSTCGLLAYVSILSLAMRPHFARHLSGPKPD